MNLAQGKNPVCQRYVATALKFLASNAEIRSEIVENNKIIPFVSFALDDSPRYQNLAAASFASMSLNMKCRKAMVESAGLIEACHHLLSNSSDLMAKRDVIYTIANIVEGSESQKRVLSCSILPLLLKIGLTCSDVLMKRDVSRALASLSSNEEMKEVLINGGCLKILVEQSRSHDVLVQRYSILAIVNLCQSNKKLEILASKVLHNLQYLIRFPDLEVGRCSALAYASLALGNHGESKSKIMNSDLSIKGLIDLIVFPDYEMQQCSLLALNAITLGANQSSKCSLSDYDGLTKIIELFRSQRE